MAANPPEAGGGAAPAPAQGPLPLLYRRIEPLNVARHGALKLRNPTDFSVARAVGAIPVTLAEFPLVARNYPIVFLRTRPGAPPVATAAVGTNPGENLFVDAEGRWLPGFYVPAYLRRYPFITGDTANAERKIVYLDVESERVSQEDGAAIYENGALTKLGQAALEFCRQYHGQVLSTAAFNAAMAAADVLVPQFFQEAGGPKPRKDAPTFLVVDEKKLAGVDDRTFLDWRAKGWLGMVYLHLFSLGNIAAMSNLRKRRAGQAAAAAMPAGNA